MDGMLESMEKLSTNAAQLVNAARRLVFPPACLFCRASLPGGDGCCRQCLEQIRIWPQACCRHCGIILPGELAPGPCGKCLKKPPAQEATYSLYEYSGPVRTAILEWKLHGREAGVRWLIEAAAPRIAELMDGDGLLLPVPMPLARMRKSGQHHAANMCSWLSDISGCPWEWRLLKRAGEQPRQSSLSGSARRTNLRHAFHLADAVERSWEQTSAIWVVDDILTTGASLHYAARALQELGRPVRALSLARAGQRR